MSPSQSPPTQYEGTPSLFRLPAETVLTRLHSAQFEVTDFNPTVAQDAIQGGRFDGTPQDEYAFLYAASDDATAVSEALLRDIPIDERGARLLPASRLRELRIGWLRTTRELQLVSLRSGVDLAAVGQDTWLTTAAAADYAMTRRWATAIREWAPWAQGFTWRTHREPAGFAYVLFADRCPVGCLAEAVDGALFSPADRDLSSGTARLYIEGILVSYRVVVM